MVGGALYSVGGYYLPFVVLGSALFVTAILTICILPKHPMDVDFNDSARKYTYTFCFFFLKNIID